MDVLEDPFPPLRTNVKLKAPENPEQLKKILKTKPKKLNKSNGFEKGLQREENIWLRVKREVVSSGQKIKPFSSNVSLKKGRRKNNKKKPPTNHGGKESKFRESQNLVMF